MKRFRGGCFFKHTCGFFTEVGLGVLSRLCNRFLVRLDVVLMEISTGFTFGLVGRVGNPAVFLPEILDFLVSKNSTHYEESLL